MKMGNIREDRSRVEYSNHRWNLDQSLGSSKDPSRHQQDRLCQLMTRENSEVFACFIFDDQQRTYIFYTVDSNYIRTTMDVLYTMLIYIICYLLYLYS